MDLNDGDGGDGELFEAVIARAYQYGLHAHRGAVAALLRAVGQTVGFALSKGKGTALPGLGSLGARHNEDTGLVPYFLLQEKFAAAHGVAQPTDFAPPQGQRKAPTEPLNFAAVVGRLDPQSGIGAGFGRSDAQTLWDCVVSCYGERALQRKPVTLDLPPVGALRCTPSSPTPDASGAARKARLAFIFSPAFCSHAGVAVPRPSSSRSQQQVAYDREHRASRESVMQSTADLAGNRPRSAPRPTRAAAAPPRRRQQAWGDEPSEPPAPRGGQQRVGFARHGGGGSREPAVGSAAAGGDDGRAASAASESSFGGGGRASSSRASTHTSNDSGDFAEFTQLEEAEQRGLHTVCRLLDVFGACDVNDTGRLAAGEVGPRLADVLGVDLTASDGSAVARWLQTAGTGRAGADWLGRLGFVRGFLAAAAASGRQGPQREMPAIVRRVAERALDPSNLLDDAAKASLASRGTDGGVPAAQLQAVLQDVLPGWPERALLWLVAGRDPRRAVEIERARQYSQQEPPIDYNAALLGAGAGGGVDGAGAVGGLPGAGGSSVSGLMQVVSPAEADLLRILHDTMQKDRLTVADAFQAMDADHDGRISVADLVAFLRNRGESVAPQVVSTLLGGEATVDYPYLRRRLDRVSAAGAMALADDWEEAVFQAVRDWAGQQRMTLKDAFAKLAGGAAKMERDQFSEAVRQAVGSDDLTAWQLDHLFRFVDASSTGKISSADWLRRFEPNARPAGWAERCFQQLADILYAKQMAIAAFVTSLDDNKDGKLSISELQRGILKLQSGLERDEQLTSAEAKELAQLTDVAGTGLVDVGQLEKRVNKGTASADTDANLLKVVHKALSKSGTGREKIALVFKRFSGNRATTDGLSYEQFLKGVNSMMPQPLGKQQQERLIKLTDRDGDGSIDVEEFIAILTPNAVDEMKQIRRYIQLHIQEEGLSWRELFDSWDADASGHIKLAELQSGFLKLPFFKQRMKLSDPAVKKHAQICFKEADPDGDGHLSVGEFERYFSGESSKKVGSIGDRRERERMERFSGAAGSKAQGRVKARGNKLAQKGEDFATRRRVPGSADAPFATDANEGFSLELTHAAATAKPKAPWAKVEKVNAENNPRGRQRFGTPAIQPVLESAPVGDASQWSSWPDVNSREFSWPKPVVSRGPKLNPLKSLEPDQRFRDRLFERNITPMEVFRAFDVDGDGFVSREEWLFGMSGRSKETEAVLGDLRELKLTLPDAERIFNLMEGSERDWVDQAAFWAVCQERKPAAGWEVCVVKQIKSWLQANKTDADKLFKMWTAAAPEVTDLRPSQFSAGLRQIGITLSAQLVAGLIRWLTKGSEKTLSRKVFASKVAMGNVVGWQNTAIGKIGALLTMGFPDNRMAWEEFKKRDDGKRSSAPHLDSWQRFRDLCEEDPLGKQLRLTANQWKELFHSMHPQNGRATLDLGEFNKHFDRSSWAKQTLAVAADAFSSDPGRSPAEIFKQVDSNGDGTIDRVEFERGMRLLNPNVKEPDVERLWGHVDTGGQGKVGLAQFCSRLGESSVGMSREVDNAKVVRNLIKASGDVEKVFKSIDKSGDGYIDSLEFQHAVTKLGAGLSARECQGVFTHLDKNGDGGLSLDEMQEWITGKQLGGGGEVGSWADQNSGSGRSAGEVFHQVVAGGPGADGTAFCVIARILCPGISPYDLQQAWALINPNDQSSFLPLTQLSTRLSEVSVGPRFDQEISEYVRSTVVGSAANVPNVFQGDEAGETTWVDLKKFQMALDRRDAGLSPRQVEELFTQLDKTGDGGLRMSELRDWVAGEGMPVRTAVLTVVRQLMRQHLGSAEAAFEWVFGEAVGTPREQLAKRTLKGPAAAASFAANPRLRRSQDTARGSRPSGRKLDVTPRARKPADTGRQPALSARSFVTAVHRLFSLSDRSVMPTKADAVDLFRRAGGVAEGANLTTQEALDRAAFVHYFSHPLALPAREHEAVLPTAIEFLASHSMMLAHELAGCKSADTAEVVDWEMFMAAGRQVTPAPTPVQLNQLWGHVDQLNNGSVLRGEFMFRTAPAVVPRNLRWGEDRLKSLHSLVKPRSVLSVSTEDFRKVLAAPQGLRAAGVEKQWEIVFKEASVASQSVFDAAVQLVRRYGHGAELQPSTGASTKKTFGDANTARRGGGAAAMVVSRDEFGQWCRASGYGPHPMTESEWRDLCARTLKSQRDRIRNVWLAVLLERRVASRHGDDMMAGELTNVLQRLGLPLGAEAVEMMLRKAAGFVTQQQRAAASDSSGGGALGRPGQRQAAASILSLSEFQRWWDEVQDVHIALGEASVQQADVNTMLQMASDPTLAITASVTARIVKLIASKAELRGSIQVLTQALRAKGGDVLPSQFSSLSAVGVAEIFGSLLAPTHTEMRCSQSEFFAAVAPVPGGATEIGVGGLAKRARGEDRMDEIMELWTFLDYRSVGFIDLPTFEQRLGGSGPPAAAHRAKKKVDTAARSTGPSSALPPHLAREWERPAVDALRKRLHAKLKQRLWKELLKSADVAGNGRHGQVEYGSFIARCKLRHYQARNQPTSTMPGNGVAAKKR